MKTWGTINDWDSVAAKYFRKLAAELWADGDYKAVKLLLTDVVCKGRRIYWRRGSL